MNKNKTIIYTVFLILFIVLFYSPLSISAAPADTPGFMFLDMQRSLNNFNENLEKAGKSIVLIVTYDIKGKEIGHGTGIFITDKGEILSNAALLKDAYSAKVISANTHYRNITILNKDIDKDLILIKVNPVNEKPASIGSVGQLNQGTEVLTIIRSRRSKLSYDKGVIYNLSIIKDQIELFEIEQLNKTIYPGTSTNGPVFNNEWELIGITTSKLSEYERLFPDSELRYKDRLQSIGLNTITSFLDTKGNVMILEPAGSRVFTKWLTGQIKEKLMGSFLYIYNFGFQKTIGVIFTVILVISMLQWLFTKFFRRNS